VVLAYPETDSFGRIIRFPIFHLIFFYRSNAPGINMEDLFCLSLFNIKAGQAGCPASGQFFLNYSGNRPRKTQHCLLKIKILCSRVISGMRSLKKSHCLLLRYGVTCLDSLYTSSRLSSQNFLALDKSARGQQVVSWKEHVEIGHIAQRAAVFYKHLVNRGMSM